MDLAAQAGFPDYRFGLEWSRIEPEDGFISRAAVDHYRRMVDGALRRGLRPFLTLHHFTLPRLVCRTGGWLARRRCDASSDTSRRSHPVLDARCRTRRHHRRAQHRRDVRHRQRPWNVRTARRTSTPRPACDRRSSSRCTMRPATTSSPRIRNSLSDGVFRCRTVLPSRGPNISWTTTPGSATKCFWRLLPTTTG